MAILGPLIQGGKKSGGMLGGGGNQVGSQAAGGMSTTQGKFGGGGNMAGVGDLFGGLTGTLGGPAATGLQGLAQTLDQQQRQQYEANVAMMGRQPAERPVPDFNPPGSLFPEYEREPEDGGFMPPGAEGSMPYLAWLNYMNSKFGRVRG